ncbi:Sterol uptake control protein 2 [Colletotrichum fructicola]|nr:Sterol uptake control protein 2 [Colletotrichum fructicola]KAF4882670.1 Sterol uptake control protein 2 [Colletotrichum fructicola]KAF4887760.1 Sterol uptake control protein 2 [Colletotrichum fructicola]KAF4924131.1 Sterol uptake control protein 2 [Colletotrichum fructicola]KAF5508053.1 Sterol uptake control protein 2 [Colletotrichum fructicola]
MDVTHQGIPIQPVFSLNEYDLGSAFPDEDLLLGDGAAYSSETLSASSPTGASSAVAANNSRPEISTSNAPVQKQRLERRGHTKSRRGCFNCKRRRIKCQETRPSCGHCVKTGLKCEYPSTPTITHQPHHQVPLFSLQDMRFFQHFMLQCYPHHPIGNENIWTHEIPCLSQSHEFLMHAILGMAACDLMAQDPSLLAFAMAHRVKAIKAIKKSLAGLPTKGTNTEHANALVATCFALTFQSTSFEDGMGEFMTFIRGILIIGAQMMCKGIKPVFVNMLDQDSRAVLEPKMVNLPLIRQEWADGAVEAIGALRHLCRDEVEIQYYDIIYELACKMHTSSWEAYRMISKHYGWWIQLPHVKFQRVIDMSNMTMVLLATHWIAAQLVMASVTKAEHECREKAPPKTETDNPEDTGSIVRWLRYLNRQIDHEHLIYNQWPVWVEDQMSRDHFFFTKIE